MSTPARDHLVDIRDRYTNRRTVNWQFLNDVIDWAEVAEAEAHAAAQADVARTLATYEGQLAETRRREEFARNDRQRLEQALEAAKAATMLEERRAKALGDDDLVQITISRSFGGWRVGALEEVAYRLRLGGATDETLVEVKDWSIQAKVPAPNMVELWSPGPREVVERAPVARPVAVPASGWLAGIASVAGVWGPLLPLLLLGAMALLMVLGRVIL